MDPGECCTVKGNAMSSGPAYGTPEAVQRQGRAIATMRKLMLMQGGLGFISLVASIAGIILGCLAEKIAYPVVDGLPLLTAILALIAAFAAYKISITTPQTEVPASTRCHVILHYVFSLLVVCIGFTAAPFALWAIIICHSDDVEKCSPNHEAILAFLIINCAALFAVSVICIYGLVCFCLYARVFGFTNQYGHQNDVRVAQLEQRVAALQSQLDRNNESPPPYSYNNTNYQIEKQ